MVSKATIQFILLLLITSIFYYMLEKGTIYPNGELFKWLHFALLPPIHPVVQSCQFKGKRYFDIDNILPLL